MARRHEIIGLGLLGALALAGAARGQSIPMTPQQAAEVEAVRQMQQDEADQQAEYDRMEAEQADADQREAQQADRDMQRADAEARRAQQERDMQAADELGRAMDDQADHDARVRDMERRLEEMDARRNADTERRWNERENARMEQCRAQYEGAIKAIHAQYDERAREVQQSGVGDHIAEQLSGLQAARDQVVNALLDEQCMAPHERRARDANEQRVQQVREGRGEMPAFQRGPNGTVVVPGG